MSFYIKCIYPLLVGVILKNKDIHKYRKEMLESVDGQILEIGFGDGKNIKYYPKNVKEIYAVDKKELYKPKISDNIKVNYYIEDAESLPFEDNKFDYVISCFTLCSIKNVDKAIKEIKRVLKPNGKFIFLEHGISPEKKIANKQNKYNKIFNKLGDGCNLNRDIEDIINKNFSKINIDKSYCNRMIKVVSYIYKGRAWK